MGDQENQKIQDYVDYVFEVNRISSSNPGVYNYREESDQIFQQLCDENNYQKSNNCIVCKKQFSMMKSAKNCKFCGCTVCEECSPKKRANPKQKSEFVRICDICDEKYLRAFLSSDFKLQKNLLQDEIKRLEEENKKMKEILDKSQQEKLKIEREYNTLKNPLDLQISSEENKLKKQKQKLDQIKKEIQEVEEQTEKTRNQKAVNEENITDNISRIQQSKYQLEITNTEIERISNKQKTTLDELTTENQNVTSYQLNNRKGMDSVLNSRFRSKQNISKYPQKESTLTNQGYDDVFRSQNNNNDSIDNYLVGLPSQFSKNQSFDINK
ncbi:hypothetical protein ABPG74_018943 [Tetrahymena malaccensis]